MDAIVTPGRAEVIEALAELLLQDLHAAVLRVDDDPAAAEVGVAERATSR